MAVDVIVVGGINTDYLVTGRSLPTPGTTVEGDVFQEAPGGKGANAAVAAARLGAHVALVGRVGSDVRGREILRRLDAEGVDVRSVDRDPEVPSGVALIMVGADGEKQILTAPGANRNVTVGDLASAFERIERARVLLVQLEVPMEAVEAAVVFARARGATVVLDPAPPRAVSDALLKDVQVIRPNADEAKSITGIAVDSQATARLAGEQLLRRGVGAAVVGAPGGNLVVTAAGETWLPHFEVETVDATGAGDAFAAALAVEVARGACILDACRFAAAAAALATTEVGAQAGLATREQAEALLRRGSPLVTGG